MRSSFKSSFGSQSTHRPHKMGYFSSRILPSEPSHFTKLYFDIAPGQLPIVYRDEYNVHFLGLEKLHPFDAAKWGHIFQYLKEAGVIDETAVVKPNEASDEDLSVVHTRQYLDSLKWSWNVAAIAEIPPLAVVPNFLVQSSYLRPMRFQTGGSVLAGKLAVEWGWAVNLGGGFHHCSAGRGQGFCPYADITLLVRCLLAHSPAVKRAMIVDLDAHQGNGHELDLGSCRNVYILDVYNSGIFPQDFKAKAGISRNVELRHYTQDDEYLNAVEENLEAALQEFHPDILVYNAGTDILEGDSLGLLSVSAEGIIRRDELVFTKARDHRVPIVMLTSGGYQKRTARIIADSILNLFNKGLISRTNRNVR
ncbi:histone deacetylase 11 [Bacillus rossius redtenbacheri]|uniref:histone deacetylase 11 n=1 Tax=Bacillus rossius redtenbacheri TaxID=93214 RepID=UPI002FDDCF06